MQDRRDEFLLEMYRQMFNDINRNILVIWQSVSVFVGAIAIFALTEKNIISFDIATCIMILLCFWLFCNLLESSYWYNRNLVIIANIERQFLVKEDLVHIHYYFGAHRPNNKMIANLKIQVYLGIGLIVVFIISHFTTRVLPDFRFSVSPSNFSIFKWLPYVCLTFICVFIYFFWQQRKKDYQEFLGNSPGIFVEITGINYGAGHGHGPGGVGG